METVLALAVIIALLTLTIAAVLFLGRRHIYRQMDDIAEVAKVRSSSRSRPE
jgi:hypothetical protein